MRTGWDDADDDVDPGELKARQPMKVTMTSLDVPGQGCALDNQSRMPLEVSRPQADFTAITTSMLDSHLRKWRIISNEQDYLAPGSSVF